MRGLKTHHETFVAHTAEVFRDLLLEHEIGALSEIFCGDHPYHAAGSLAQIWSLSEVTCACRRTRDQ